MGSSQRNKGKRGEREWRDQLRDQGFTARRGQQFSGSADSPDVVCEELDSRFHFEVKRVEALNMRDAVDQAVRDAGAKVPVLAHRRNNSPWLATMRADDWFALVREVLRMSDSCYRPIDIAKTHVKHDGKWFFISTIEWLPTSPWGQCRETCAWEYDMEEHERGAMVYGPEQYPADRHSVHFQIAEDFARFGRSCREVCG